ncbi:MULTISPECIES: MFS transporter [Streptomyces]|uniref:MFS transporter n=1 Tax=Streptomyces ramulosus TaxID=47762 RepID=A0ABW1FWE8_9ACTN
MTGATGEPVRRQRQVVLCVMLGMLFGPLNSTMVTVALPSMARDLSLTPEATGWIVTSYLIAMAGLHPVVGKLGDRWNRRRLMLCATALALVSSLGASLSGNLAALVVFRLLQAVAGSAMAPNGIVLLRQVVPAERLGSVLGTAGATSPLAAAAGPAVGTVLVSAFGWRSIFLVNLVIMAVPLVLGAVALPRPPQPRTRTPFDVLGAITALVTFVALAALLNAPSSPPALIVWAGVTGVALTALLVRELRIPDPALQPRLLARPRFLAAAVGVCLTNFAMYGVLLTVPALFQLHPDWPGTLNGVVLAVMTGLSAVLTPLGGRLVDRYGANLPALVGVLLLTSGLAAVAVTLHGITITALLIAVAVVGAGLGLCTAAYRTESVQAVPFEETGMASGLFFTFRYLGSIVCSSLLGGPLAPRTTTAMAVDYAVFAAVCLACVVLTLLLPRMRRQVETSAEDGRSPAVEHGNSILT